jgi:hypothetical protein
MLLRQAGLNFGCHALIVPVPLLRKEADKSLARGAASSGIGVRRWLLASGI